MADDQKPKTMDINDLVRELSKSSTSPVTSPMPTGRQAPIPAPQTPRPPFPTPKPTTSPPMAGSIPVPSVPKPPVSPPSTPPPKPLEMPKPKFSSPPIPFNQPSSAKPVPPPVGGSVPAVILPTPGVKEYQSSIRTMNEDISKIKQGQQPTGVPVPRKVEQVIPTPQPISPKPVPPTSGPSQQFKVPSVNLGETQKIAPIAPPRDVPKAPLPPKIEPKPQIYVPQESPKGDNRNMLFIGIGAVAIVAGFSYWFFVLRASVPEVVIETPTPTLTATPVHTLNSIFSGLESQTVCTVECTPSDFISNINNGTINGGLFKKIYLSENDTSLTITQLLDNLKLTYPADLKDLIGQDYIILVYGQKEIFDPKGQVKIDATVEKSLVFVDEVKDTLTASQLGRVWEVEIADNLKTVLQFDPKNQASPSFLDNLYGGVSIRYKNFPYADRSIDYAVVSAFNGKSYLVIAGSREAMYATIDRLKGF